MEYCSADEMNSGRKHHLFTLLAMPGPEAFLDFHESAFRRFMEVLPEEPIQGLALACRNQVHVLSRRGDQTAASIPYTKLCDDRPRVLAQSLHDALEASGQLLFQCGQYVERIMEAAFLDLAICCGKSPPELQERES